MQIATVKHGQPWVCSVYYIADYRTVYWMSWPTRRHSQELAKNPKAAVAIVLHSEQPVVGMQAEGVVEEVTDLAEVERMTDKYVQKHGVGQQFAANFAAGTNKHHMYKMNMRKVVIFDERHFAGDPRQEVPVIVV